MNSEIKQYIDQFDEVKKEKLKQIFQIGLKLVPSAEQKITYGMPTFKSTQNIFHFAAFKNHIGFYPGPDIILIFAEQLTDYKTSKGAIQFKLKEQLPLKLI